VSFKIDKKPTLIQNNIPTQTKVSANSLTVQEWNSIVNILKTQTNYNAVYLEKLHRFFFGPWNSGDTASHSFPEFEQSGLIPTLVSLFNADIQLTKEALQLDNVDNTADMDKPISTAVQIELGLINTQLEMLGAQLAVTSTEPNNQNIGDIWFDISE
jgi:hypothetical protein